MTSDTCQGVKEKYSPFPLLLQLMHLFGSGRWNLKGPEDIVHELQRQLPRLSPGTAGGGLGTRCRRASGVGRGGAAAAGTPVRQSDAAVVLSPQEKAVLCRRGAHVGDHGAKLG